MQVKIITESKGAPDTERIDLSTVRVSWDDVFPKGTACEEVLCVHKSFPQPGGLPGQVHIKSTKSNQIHQVDFLIKSHPLDAPSNYKLSDLTLKVLFSNDGNVI